jgi:hypothetical protein
MYCLTCMKIVCKIIPKIILFVVVFSFTTSCNVLNINADGQRPQMYYDLATWVHTQDALLKKSSIKIHKTVVMNDKKEVKDFEKMNWLKELDFVIQANINKSALQGLYKIQDSTTSEHQIITYLPQNGSLHTQFLKIILDKTSKMPVRIEAKMQAQNYLYETEKNIILTCKVESGKSVLENYEIKGRQKMIFSKEERFEIQTGIKSL